MLIIRRYFKNIGITLLTIVMMTLVCIQIPYVKSHFVQYIVARIAVSQGVIVKINDVHGILPFHLNVKSINISDASGVLAEVHNLDVNVAARMLLVGKLQIESITASKVKCHQKSAGSSLQVPNQLPSMLARILPIALDQTVLKRVHINELKTPAANLSFRFHKEGSESIVELKSTVKENKKEPPIEGIFCFSPKRGGAIATVRLHDRIGLLADFPLIVEGALQIEDLNTFLPVGDLTIHANHKKTIVQFSTIDNNTRVHIAETNNHVLFDINIKQMLEHRETQLQHIKIRTQGNYIQGKGNFSYEADRIILDADGSHDDGMALTFKAIWTLSDKSIHVEGNGHWQTTPFQFAGDVANVGVNICLKKAMFVVNGHILKLVSEKGLSLDDQVDVFTCTVDDYVFEGDTAFNRDGYLMRLKPTKEWAKNNIVEIHINAVGAQINGAFDIDFAKLTNDIVQGTGHTTFKLDHTLSGVLSCTLPGVTVNGSSFGNTTAKIQLDKGNGTISFITGSKDETHLPYGVAKAQLLFQKQMLQLDSFYLVYHQHVIALKNPMSVDFKADKFSNFSIRIGQKGSIHCTEKKIIFENIPLITACIFVPSWDMDGVLNGKIEMSHSVDQWKGQFVLSNLIPYASNPLTNNALFQDFSWTIQLEHQTKQLLIDMYTERGKARIFRANGTLSLDRDKLLQNMVDFNVAGELDISLISSLFNTSDRLGGILNLNVGIKGALSDISMSGHIYARNGLYDSADNGTYIANIAGTLKAVGKKLVIEKLVGNDVRDLNNVNEETHVGTVDITGGFEFSGLSLPHFALNLNLNDLIVVHRDDMTMRARGDIKINGSGLQSKITGSVLLSPSLVMLEEFSNDDASYIEIEELDIQKKKKEVLKTPLFPIELVLNVDKNFYIRDLDLGLMSQWIGSITVKGDMSAPYLEGTLSATKGRLSFFGKPLKVKEAKLTFDREHRNNPNVWLIAMREVDDVTVCLQVSGYSPSPKISFVSDPALPEDEVLARLLFGKELSKISAGQSAQLASVAASLNNKKGFNLLENLRSSFGFDTLEFKENQMKASSAESGQTATQALSVGKEFENIRVSIDQSIGSAGSKATVSTALGKNVYLDLEVGEKNAGSGAGLSWVYRY